TAAGSHRRDGWVRSTPVRPEGTVIYRRPGAWRPWHADRPGTGRFWPPRIRASGGREGTTRGRTVQEVGRHGRRGLDPHAPARPGHVDAHRCRGHHSDYDVW